MKKIRLIMIVIMILMLVAGCSKNEVENNGISEDSKKVAIDSNKSNEATENEEEKGLEKAELKWLTIETPSLTPEFYDFIINKFNEKYPQITIKRQLFPTGDRQNYVSTLYATQQLPDIVFEASVIKDVDGALLELPKDFIEKFSESAMLPENSTYISLAKTVKMGVFYNRELFDKYGLEEPKNWAEFEMICAMLKENGEVPLVAGGPDKPWLTGTVPDTMWISEMDHKYGNQIAVQEAIMSGELKYNGPEMRDILTRWKKLIDNGYYHEGSYSFTRPQMEDIFYNQEAVMVVSGLFMAGFIDDRDMDFEVGWFPVPLKDSIGQGLTSISGPVGISGQSKYPEQAIAFLRFLVEDEEVYTKWISADRALSSLKKDYSYELTPVTKMVLDEVAGLEEAASVILPEELASPKGLEQTILKMWQHVFTGADIEEEMNLLQEAFEDGMEQEGRR